MKWPTRSEVHAAIDQWVKQLADAAQPAEVIAIGYFGSYARDDAGVGSDLDIVIIIAESSLPFERRANLWDLCSIPVPVEAQVYTAREWNHLPE
ncbi:MAG: nucleotidyltransferase domain-containing protein, partial [Phormidesmis sp.]